MQGQLMCIFQNGPVDRFEIGREWVGLDRRCQLVAPGMILDLGPEILAVLGSSVVAVIPRRNRRGDHLALGPGERALGGMHHRGVELGRGAKDLGPRALKADDVVDLAGSGNGGLVEALEGSGGLGGVCGSNPGHGDIPP